jgi:hypothetical protein
LTKGDEEEPIEKTAQKDSDSSDNDDDDEMGGGLLIPLYELIKGLLPRLVNPKPHEQ